MLARMFWLIALFYWNVSPVLAEPMVLNSYLKPPLGTEDGSGQFDLLIKEAFRRIKQPLIHKWLPGKRGIIMAERGIHDGHYTRVSAVVEEYKNLIVVRQPIYRSTHIAITIDPNIQIKDWDDLRNYRVGYPMHWKFPLPHISKFGEPMAAPSPESALKMLNAGRVDVALFEYLYLQKMSKDLNLTDFIVQRPALSVDDVYLLLIKKHQSTALKLANALQFMTEDGTFAQLCPICILSLSVDLN